MSLGAGTRLGPYEIVAPLAAGGMGEVYRARDTRLDRDVAIKVLPAALAADPVARARFEREAKAIAALSHPNILAIHEFGTHDSIGFTVTELLDGSTLRERLHGGSLSAHKAVDYAMQVAHGLAAAHDRGIVHRDLKPENLFVTADGRVKILDFGLARVTSPESAAAAAPTTIQTDPALVMGTAGYMSPEQVRGQTVDSRSDLFALGAILYEMLSGRRAFKRDTAPETMTAILKDEPPDLSHTIAAFPPALDRIVRRSLEKNPSERFQSARDLAFALDTATSGAVSTGAAPVVGATKKASRTPALAWILGAALALAAGAAAGWWAHARQSSGAEPSPSTFAQLTDFPGIERTPSVSADGKTVVYASDSSGNFDIYSLRVGGRNPVNLTADSPDVDATPVLSPAADQVAFRSERAGGGIFVMGATGESIRRVTDFGFDPAWSPDGRRLVVASMGVATPFEKTGTGQLSIVTLATGTRSPLKTAGDAMQPSWSPDGRHIAFWGVERGTSRRDIWTVAADGRSEPVQVTSDTAIDWKPVWSPDGRHLYFASDRGGVMNLWRIAIDGASGRPLGTAMPFSVPASFIDGFSLTTDGRVVYAATDRRSTLQRLDFDPQREAVTGSAVLLQSPRTVRALDWSPDAQMLVFSNFGSYDNLYLLRADGSGYRQLTDDGFRNRGPHWFPDGSRLLFYSNRSRIYQAWSIRPDGSGLQQLTDTPLGVVLPIISPTADRIAYRPSLSSSWSIAELRSPGAERITDMPTAPGAVTGLTPSAWSRDGSRIAMFEGPSGVADPRMFVYDLSTKQYTPLPSAGASPAWLPDDRRLVFSTRRGVGVIDTATGRTREVFKLPTALATPSFGLALSADGRRIAVLLLEEQSDLWMLTPQ